MKELNIKRVFSIISAICFLVFGIMNFMSYYSIINTSYAIPTDLSSPSLITWSSLYTFDYKFNHIMEIIVSITFGILAIMLFTNKKNKILLAGSSLNLIASLILLVNVIKLFKLGRMDIIFICLASIVLFVDILVNVIPSLNKNLNITKVLTFILPVVMIISIIFYLIKFFSSDYDSYDIPYLVRGLLLLIGFISAGLWLSNFEFGKAKNTTTTTQYQPVQKKKTSDADKLLTYKKLLDNGSITQEEFEQKKSEVINNK
ncbi:MAG: SHOCT domain-containing protein [Ruminococcus sp.]|nr:SHOCT domain-containing protein [Ruminococcus sp.]MDD6709069.1 SHOCT domain-containing protein [Ruminococcus sp.]